ncbi:MAG: hypothetical protein DWQ34_17065 [Planctomycetota bacterium]|nr:MAG: hypothetical protein DWQ34_17065 [Planctomycetota bacterium]
MLRHHRILWGTAVALLAAVTQADCAEPDGPDGDATLTIGTVRLERIEHHDRLTGEKDHFGNLLFDTDGKLVRHDGHKTWMYTGALQEGKWTSYAREFDLDTLEVAERSQVLMPIEGDKWASIHLVIRVAEDFYLAFYSTGRVIRAAVADRPDAVLTPDPDFEIAPSQDWEKGCSLESDGGFVKIDENEDALKIWMLYDTLCAGSAGRNGWAEVHVDKRTRRVSLAGKHPDNPIDLLLPDRLAARTGGNLDSSVRFGEKYALFYLSKPDVRTYRMSVALSDDPLFQEIDENVELAGPRGRERVIEKFQFYEHKGDLFVIYEVSDAAGDWQTGLRRYRVE